MIPTRSMLPALAAGLLLLGACGTGGGDGAGPGVARIVVSTAVWGDVVAEVVGDCASVELLTPAGADPHDFALSARQAASLRQADLVVLSGLGLEEPFQGSLESAEGDGVALVTLVDDAEQPSDDPHVWQDPGLVADTTGVIADAVAEHTDCDPVALDERAETYADEIRATDAEVASELATIPEDRRVLVTNHDAFGRFAQRYGFEELGSVVPGAATGAAASSADLAALAQAMKAAGIDVIFTESSGSTRLAETLAAEIDRPVEVVELYAESLGPPGSGADTYLGMLETNAGRVADALAG